MQNIGISLFFLLVLASCAVSAKKVVVPLGKALLIAETDAVLSALIPLGQNNSVDFSYLDNQKVGNYFNKEKILEVEPGTHVIKTSCQILGPVNAWGDSEHTIEVKAGYKYIFYTHYTAGNNCAISYKEEI
jgi:hypothetical protein